MPPSNPSLWWFTRATLRWSLLGWLPVVLYLWLLLAGHNAEDRAIGGNWNVFATAQEFEGDLRLTLFPGVAGPEDGWVKVVVSLDRVGRFGIPVWTRLTMSVSGPPVDRFGSARVIAALLASENRRDETFPMGVLREFRDQLLAGRSPIEDAHTGNRVLVTALAIGVLVACGLPIYGAAISRGVAARRRWRRGLCYACGYDPSAVVTVCPECGTSVPPFSSPPGGGAGKLSP